MGHWLSTGAVAFAISAAVGVALCASSGCSASAASAGSGGSGGAVGLPKDTGGAGTGGAFTGAGVGGGSQQRNDFTHPVLADGAPTNAPSLFGTADQGTTGPCLFEPELGALFPNNWLRPRFRYIAAQSDNLFEIKLVIPHETSPLVIYTTKTTWTMDANVWSIISSVGVGGPIHVTIRSATYDGSTLTSGPSLGSEGDIEVAPAGAPGSVVYWTTSNGTLLKGFKIGDESVQDVLKPADAGTQCVACHSSTPDGAFVGFSASDNASDGSIARFALRSVKSAGTMPTYLSPSAQSLLARTSQELPFFSKAHWTTGDRVGLSMYQTGSGWEIAWTDLEATSQAQGTGWGFFARNGDPYQAAGATIRHDGTAIAYTSAPDVGAGIIESNGDIYTIPYASRMGGAATPVAGASDPAYNEYYPIFSPDDALLAFNRVPAGESSYNDPDAEVFVLASGGGQPTRLAANDPPSCLGLASPGVTNSWAKWAPEVTTIGDTSYYWLVFSSTRNQATQGPQLYVTGIVKKGNTIETHAALYFWNQPEDEKNHTPAWDVFDLPPPSPN